MAHRLFPDERWGIVTRMHYSNQHEHDSVVAKSFQVEIIVRAFVDFFSSLLLVSPVIAMSKLCYDADSVPVLLLVTTVVVLVVGVLLTVLIQKSESYLRSGLFTYVGVSASAIVCLIYVIWILPLEP